MHFLLVHGSWHGPWCWRDLIPLLESEGHQVTCADLPGYDEIYPSQVTYKDYYEYLEEKINQCKEPITLVAHSMSGIIAGPLADRLHQKLKHVFFIGAFLPQCGQSLLDVAISYDDSDIPKILQEDRVNGLHILDKDGAKETLYHGCSEEVKEWASNQLRPQPYAPLQTPLEWEDSFQGVDKRVYIVCEQDRDVSVTAQRDMARNHRCRVVNMNCGHFPFLSHPDQLAKILTM